MNESNLSVIDIKNIIDRNLSYLVLDFDSVLDAIENKYQIKIKLWNDDYEYLKKYFSSNIKEF
jgi:hypothetical protein